MWVDRAALTWSKTGLASRSYNVSGCGPTATPKSGAPSNKSSSSACRKARSVLRGSNVGDMTPLPSCKMVVTMHRCFGAMNVSFATALDVMALTGAMAPRSHVISPQKSSSNSRRPFPSTTTEGRKLVWCTWRSDRGICLFSARIDASEITWSGELSLRPMGSSVTGRTSTYFSSSERSRGRVGSTQIKRKGSSSAVRGVPATGVASPSDLGVGQRGVPMLVSAAASQSDASSPTSIP
mmetsp:Transcript_36071/g.83700  ORF Transcript_36071/g.83700 Transcript_36071/m.83700 type:complete len:238 (-) Transcript_36071:451-1164(-)